MVSDTRCHAACRVSAAAAALLLSWTAQAQEPVATQVTRPIQDAIVQSYQVTGGLLVGLSPEINPQPSAPDFPLAVYARIPKKQRICVKLVTVDGRYQSGDVEYELPPVATFSRILLPYRDAKHFDFIARQDPREIAVLARTGACPADDGSPLIAAWSPTRNAISRLVFAVRTGGRDTTIEISPSGDNWGPPRECRHLERQAGKYDALCTTDAPAGEANFRVQIKIYSAVGTLQKPVVEFEVVRTGGSR